MPQIHTNQECYKVHNDWVSLQLNAKEWKYYRSGGMPQGCSKCRNWRHNINMKILTEMILNFPRKWTRKSLWLYAVRNIWTLRAYGREYHELQRKGYEKEKLIKLMLERPTFLVLRELHKSEWLQEIQKRNFIKFNETIQDRFCDGITSTTIKKTGPQQTQPQQHAT